MGVKILTLDEKNDVVQPHKSMLRKRLAKMGDRSWNWRLIADDNGESPMSTINVVYKYNEVFKKI
jgi:hypothetical protein